MRGQCGRKQFPLARFTDAQRNYKNGLVASLAKFVRGAFAKGDLSIVGIRWPANCRFSICSFIRSISNWNNCSRVSGQPMALDLKFQGIRASISVTGQP